jgi:cell wall-associated NlpC family hydrolase
MTPREKLIARAMQWKGAQWQHQACIPFERVDCGNYVADCLLASGVFPEVSFARDYPAGGGKGLLASILDKYAVPVERADLLPADILAFSSEQAPDDPRHVAFLISRSPDYVIEAHMDHGVVRHRLSNLYWRRVHSLWTIRGIDP